MIWEPNSRYKERSEIEALFFSINASLKALNQPVYVPKDGQLIHDIERGWNNLEKAEHRREVALRDELLRQERLEQLAYKFDKKVRGEGLVWGRLSVNVKKLNVKTWI